MGCRLTILVTLLVLAAGCAERCRVSGPGWREDLEPVLPDQYENSQELKLTASGQIYLAGSFDFKRPLSDAKLKEILTVMDSMPLRPWLIVRVAPDADCDRVRALKAILDPLPMCAEGACIEGSVWDSTFGRS